MFVKKIIKEKNYHVICVQSLNNLIKMVEFAINVKEENLFICVLLIQSQHLVSKKKKKNYLNYTNNRKLYCADCLKAGYNEDIV